MLETIRAYAFDKLAESGEAKEVARRHAEFFRDLLAPATEGPFVSFRDLPRYVRDIDNMRAALEWAFSRDAEKVDIGVGLAVAAGPVLLATSMLPECHRWSGRALLALDDAMRGGAEEMHLQANLGFSLMLMHGLSDQALAALERSVGIAEERGATLYQMSLLAWLNIFYTRNGNCKAALQYARRSSAVANVIGDAAAIALVHFLLGNSLHIVGDLEGARVALEAALRYRPQAQRTGMVYLGFDHDILARINLANTLCLQGHLRQAAERARETVKDAQDIDHPIALSIVLRHAVLLFLWIGDLPSAEELIDWYAANARSHALAPQIAVGHALEGELAIRRGDVQRGVEILRGCVDELHAVRYKTMDFKIAFAEGLSATGRFAESMSLIDDGIRQVEANGGAIYMPELLRVKGNLLLAKPRARVGQAEICFRQSLELSRQQGARVWELRTATDLAKLMAAQGRRENARTLLEPVFTWFVEGLDTDDLKAAERLLTTLH